MNLLKMKISDQYDHLNGLRAVQTKDGLLAEVCDILSDSKVVFGVLPPKQIKSRISGKFNDKGWADKVRLGSSKLTINFLKSKVGVCFQIGNVARTYADILKLCQLYKNGVIDVGIMIVPHKPESKKLGANYAQFDRLASELEQFKDIISTPILVLGLSN